MQEKTPLWRRLVRTGLFTLLAVVLVAAFYIAVIVGHPLDEPVQQSSPPEQPLPPALSAPVLISTFDDLTLLADAFPAPLMACPDSANLTFIQGVCADVPFEDGVARTITLTYRTAAGQDMTIMSIYPARALDVLGKGEYTLSAATGQPLAGLRSVRMEKAGSVRMHAQSDSAVYAVTMPELSSTELRSLTAVLYLTGGN